MDIRYSTGKEPVMGVEGLQTMQSKVLTHQITAPMPIEQYRLVLQILDSRSITDREKMRQFLKDNPELAKEIEEKIRAAAKGAPVEEVAGAEEKA